MAADGAGNAWVSGFTDGSLGGPNAGDYDAFVAKFSTTAAPIPLPPPRGLVLFCSAGLVA